MNILFILRGNGMGGVEIVTQVLANKFVAGGHHTSIFIFRKESDISFVKRLDKRVQLYQYHKYSSDSETVSALRNFILDHHIQLIVNQWGLPLVPIRAIRKATEGLDALVVSVFHNAPDANGRIQGINVKIAQSTNGIKRALLRCIRYAFRLVTSCSMAYNYRHSDKYLVLSESYCKVFQDFTRLRETPKLGVMTNPITLESSDVRYVEDNKLKEIIYVGRLDSVQKCVSRVLDTWALLADKHPGWRLTIVGDGPDRQNLENKAAGLKQVYFEGFQSPLRYYQRASILLLTSDFEGFPLVLAEAMSCGVVPVVYNSFAAVHDIIDTGVDGFIVPKVDNVFSAENMAKGVEDVIRDCETTRSMSMAAIAKSKNYSIETIYDNWMRLFHELGVKD